MGSTAYKKSRPTRRFYRSNRAERPIQKAQELHISFRNLGVVFRHLGVVFRHHGVVFRHCAMVLLFTAFCYRFAMVLHWFKALGVGAEAKTDEGKGGDEFQAILHLELGLKKGFD